MVENGDSIHEELKLAYDHKFKFETLSFSRYIRSRLKQHSSKVNDWTVENGDSRKLARLHCLHVHSISISYSARLPQNKHMRFLNWRMHVTNLRPGRTTQAVPQKPSTDCKCISPLWQCGSRSRSLHVCLVCEFLACTSCTCSSNNNPWLWDNNNKHSMQYYHRPCTCTHNDGRSYLQPAYNYYFPYTQPYQ